MQQGESQLNCWNLKGEGKKQRGNRICVLEEIAIAGIRHPALTTLVFSLTPFFIRLKVRERQSPEKELQACLPAPHPWQPSLPPPPPTPCTTTAIPTWSCASTRPRTTSGSGGSTTKCPTGWVTCLRTGVTLPLILPCDLCTLSFLFLPFSYRNYSVIAPEFLHPLSRDYLQRKEEARRLRMHYKVAGNSLFWGGGILSYFAMIAHPTKEDTLPFKQKCQCVFLPKKAKSFFLLYYHCLTVLFGLGFF